MALKQPKYPKIKDFERSPIKPNPESSHWYWIDWLITNILKLPTFIKVLLKRLYIEIKYHIKKYIFILLCLSLLGTFWTYLGLQNTKLAVKNINNDKTFFIDKLRNILSESRANQVQDLNSLQFKLEENLTPVTKLFFVDGMVKKDLTRINTLIKKWLKSIDALSKYKLTPNGLEPTLFLNRTFSQDINLFLDDLPDLLKESKQLKTDLWYYQIIGSNQTKRIFDAVDEALELATIFSENKQGILDALGHFSPKRLVIFTQNPGEARPTGGFVGSYIPVDIDQGRVRIGQSQSIYYVDGGPKTTKIANPLTWYYGWQDNVVDVHGIRNANMFSCFPDTAKYLEREFSTLPNGYPIDQITFITPELLLGMIPEWAVLNIEGENVPKNALLDKIEKITALEVEDPTNPKKAISGILTSILEELPSIVKSQNPIDTLNYFQDSLQARNLQIWFKDSNSQKLITKLNLGSENTCANSNPNSVISPIIVNLSGDKRNLITKNEFEMSQKGTQYYLKYTQTLPPNSSSILQRSFDIDRSLTFVGIQVPANSNNIKISSPQAYNLPFLRPGYEVDLIKNDRKYEYPQEISSIIKSSYNLYNNEGLTPGFSYLQPDGSQVIGLYIHDQLTSTVEFNWDMKDTKNVVFFGQPGLSDPSLTFNVGAIKEAIKIQGGVKLN